MREQAPEGDHKRLAEQKPADVVRYTICAPILLRASVSVSFARARAYELAYARGLGNDLGNRNLANPSAATSYA